MRLETCPNLNIHEDLLASFLGIPFDHPEAFDLIKESIKNKEYPRQQLAAILEEYNRKLGNDASSLQNITKLKEPGSYCVVTGQQLGMQGGPIYTILKGISCLLLAKKTGAIPIYWLATEDHDVAEIDHAYCIDLSGDLKRFYISLPKEGFSIEDIKLTQTNVDEISAFWNFLDLQEQPIPMTGELYSVYMAKILMRLFIGTGMVFLEPKLLRQLAVPFFTREIKECQSIRKILKVTTERLKKAGGVPVINVQESTNLFIKNNQNKRVKLRFNDGAFTVGQESFSLDDILSKIDREPQLFSCNVAARPVLQNLLLPVIAYAAGPTEREYHRQLRDYYQFHGASMAIIVPRISATLISPAAQKILEATGLKPWNGIPKQVSGKDVSKKNLHFLRNLITPHNESQERLLNWWEFQSKTQENLVMECTELMTWDSSALDHYIYL